jgi:hypothetical protein
LPGPDPASLVPASRRWPAPARAGMPRQWQDSPAALMITRACT